MARGVDRRRIFVDDEDYAAYTRLLGAVTERQGWHLLAYCLMPNHVHLQIETPETNLANGMQWLHSRYALLFNVRHDRKGHLFEGPYKSPMVTSDDAFIRTIGYIALNPATAVLCRRAAEWSWSSHAAVASGKPLPSWLAHERVLERLEAATGRRCYQELIAARERTLGPY